MARKPINYGTTPGDGTGDVLFDSFKNANDNFIELYSFANNPTTSALSAATLNATYPSVMVGFRVYCESITPNRLIYVKSPSGWVSTAINTVS